MTKDELAEEICRQLKKETVKEKREVLDVLDAAIQAIRCCVADGNEVTLRGFGTIGHKEKKARVRNSFGRGAVEIPAHSVPRFKPARIFRDMVAREDWRP